MPYNTFYPGYTAMPSATNAYAQAVLAQQYPQMQAYQQQYVPAQQAQTAQPRAEQQIQNGGFVSCRGRAEAEQYPVAPGTSVTFRDELAPYIYTKTMGFSQLDRPVFEAYKLTKEDVTPTPDTLPVADKPAQKEIDLSQYVLKTDFDALAARIATLESNAKPLASRVDAIEAIFPQRKKKKEGDDND